MRSPRSVLYIPASKPHYLERLGEHPADALILDLEDGVAPSTKDQGRENLLTAVRSGKVPAEIPWMIRINAAGTEWHRQDLELVSILAPAMVVVPKAEDPDAVAELSRRFAQHGSETALMIETVHGVGAVRELAGVGPDVRMLIFGSGDYRRSLGARPDPSREWERCALHELLIAARMHDCLAIDSVYFQFRDREGLVEHSRIARDLGFDGKSCIHPGQVPVINGLFASTAQEVAWAKAVLSEWELQDGDTRGVIVVDGEMVEKLHLAVARRILERTDG